VAPFKEQVKFDIFLFEGHIDAYVLEKWVNFLEGYYFVKKKFDTKMITFTLLKSLRHVKDWWECYQERHNEDDSLAFRIGPTWEAFVDSFKEDFYPVGNYDEQYTRLMTLHQERD
jgi:hypothetical protein